MCPQVTLAAKKDAIALLSLKPDEKPWHRDGWMFQAISWIAAHNDGGIAIRAPHLIKAHKGFDGLKLELSDAGEVTAVVVFEDKATENPRATIRDDVRHSRAAAEKGVDWPCAEAWTAAAVRNAKARMRASGKKLQPVSPSVGLHRFKWMKSATW